MGGVRRGLRVRVLQRGVGRWDNDWVEARVREAVSMMFSTRMANTLRLRIELRQTKLERKNAAGAARYADVYDARRKEYTIAVHKNLSLEPFLYTLVHELQHVKQYAEQRLRHRSRGRSGKKVWGWLWRGPDESRSTFYPYDSIDYRDRPWETEAYEAANEFGRKLVDADRERERAKKPQHPGWKHFKLDLAEAA